MKCSECAFARALSTFNEFECRKNAPVLVTVEPHFDLRKYVPAFPIMKGFDWCGEFKPAQKVEPSIKSDNHTVKICGECKGHGFNYLPQGPIATQPCMACRGKGIINL